MLDAVPKRLTLCKFWLIPCNVTKHQQTSWTDPAISLPRNVGQDNPRQRPGHLPWCRAHAAPAKCSASFACWSNAHGELRTWISFVLQFHFSIHFIHLHTRNLCFLLLLYSTPNSIRLLRHTRTRSIERDWYGTISNPQVGDDNIFPCSNPTQYTAMRKNGTNIIISNL